MLGLPVVVIAVVVPVGLIVTAAHYVVDIVADVRLWRDGDPEAIAVALKERAVGQE